jgi:hypothetical protein
MTMAILPGDWAGGCCAALGAAKRNNMKPPDGIEQHRLRALRGDEGLRDLED